MKTKKNIYITLIVIFAISTPQNYNLPYETGFIEKKYLGSTQYIDGTSSAANGGHTLIIPNDTIGFTHVHNNKITQDPEGNDFNGAVKMLSPIDLIRLIKICKPNAGTTPQDAYGIMISDEAIFSLTLLDGNIDMGIVNLNWADFEDNYNAKAKDILNNTDLTVTQRNEKLQNMMLSGLDKLGLKDKVGLFQGDVETLPNGTKKLNWTRKTLDANNNVNCISFYLPQVIKARATLSKSLSLKYLRFNL